MKKRRRDKCDNCLHGKHLHADIDNGLRRICQGWFCGCRKFISRLILPTKKIRKNS